MLFIVVVWCSVCFVIFVFLIFVCFVFEKEKGRGVEWVGRCGGSGRTPGWGKDMIKMQYVNTFSKRRETFNSSLERTPALVIVR